MASAIPDLQGTGLDAGPRPVWIKKHESDKAPHLVHPRYLMRAHTREELAAVVTQNGVPIEQNGETLTIGIVPAWCRYAIGPVVGGKAELLSQDDFTREHEIVYMASFQLLGQRPDDKDKRYIPNVRAFVSVKADPFRPGRTCPLGTHLAKESPKEGKLVYDATRDAFTDRKANEVEERLRAELTEKTARLDALEAKVNQLVGREVEAPRAAVKAAAPDKVTAKCGKEVDPRYIKQHARMCKKGCRDAAAA